MTRLLWRGLVNRWPLWCYLVGHRTAGMRRATGADVMAATGLTITRCERCTTAYWAVRDS